MAKRGVEREGEREGGREGGREEGREGGGYVHAIALHDDPFGHHLGRVFGFFVDFENDARAVVDGVELAMRREGGREGGRDGGERGGL
jgi:hypothetical protein